MGLIFIRTTIIFISLLLIMRLMGKRQIGEMQPFELVITLLIAELACIPMSDTTIPLLYGVISMIAIFFLHQIMLLIDLKCRGLKTLVAGKPAIVINKNGIDISELKKNNLDINDLIESLRGAGYFAFDDVDYALYEASGKFSAMAKENKETSAQKSSIPLLIITDGKFEKHNLDLTHTTEKYFLQLLEKESIQSLKKVFVLTIDGTGKIYLQCRGEKYKILQTALPKESVW